jgi:hypothetical protein
MGEAKRRKRSDANYGKKIDYVTFGDLSPLFFAKYGRGIFVNRPGKTFIYAINCEYLLRELDRAFLSTYDPEKEVIIVEYFDSKKEEGLSYLLKDSNDKCRLRLTTPKTEIEEIMNNSDYYVVDHDLSVTTA